MSLLNKHTKAVEKVLKTWKGTPEELGATLYNATNHIWSLTEQGRNQERSIRATARKQILECDGGAELLLLEHKLIERGVL